MAKHRSHRNRVEGKLLRERIYNAISGEDAKNPITDQQLAEELNTTAELIRYYRRAMDILPAHERMEISYE